MAGQKGINIKKGGKQFDYPGVKMYSVDGEWVPGGDITQQYGEEEANRIMDNSTSTFMYFIDGRGWVPEMQLAHEWGIERQEGNLSQYPASKSIDDIINSANIAEFLSEATADKTNVDASSKEVKQLLPGRRDVDGMMRALFPDAYLEMQRSQLEKKLRDLDTKPLKM